MEISSASSLHQERAKQLTTRVQEAILETSSKNSSKDISPVPNPFVYQSKLWTFAEVLKVLLFGPILLPLRILIFMLCLMLTLALLKLSISFGFNPQEPMHGWRRALQYPVAYLTRFVMFVFGVYYVETTGKPCTLKEAKTIVCAPHSTLLDTSYISYAFSCPSSISKLENLHYPLFGILFRAFQVVTVDRNSKANRQQAFQDMKLRGTTTQTRHLMVFPEGTCTNRSALISFKLGAFAGGNAIQPVGLEWPWASGFDMTWTAAGPSRLALGLHLMCQPWIRMKVHFLPVYVPSEEEILNLRLFADNVRLVLAKKLNLPVTQHSIEDMFLAKEARRLHLSNSKELMSFELQELDSLFAIDLRDAKTLLQRYGRAFQARQRISCEEFAMVLGIPCTPAVQELFDLVRGGAEEDGVDFQQLLVRICQLNQVLNGKENKKDSIALIWEVIAEGKESLSSQEVNTQLARLFQGKATKPTLFPTKQSVDLSQFQQVMETRAELLFAAIKMVAATETKTRPAARLSILSQQLPLLPQAPHDV